MAVGQGFSKVATSGSVFHYDTGDVINSFKVYIRYSKSTIL